VHDITKFAVQFATGGRLDAAELVAGIRPLTIPPPLDTAAPQQVAAN
jgi:hypothetical protein